MMDALPDPIPALAEQVISALIVRGLTIATAESCTGGLIAGALTSIAGSSAAVYGGFVTYADEAKEKVIGVRPETLRVVGAVSEQTVREMADGARRATGVDYTIAVTGIAGPGGGTPQKPVGLVWFGVAGPDGTHAEKRLFGEIGRNAVRARTVETSLDLVLAALAGDKGEK